MTRIPVEVKSILPPNAKLKKRTKTRLGETYVFYHFIGKYLVDGDRLVIKVKHGSTKQAYITEKTWQDDCPIPPSPPSRLERGAIPVLLNVNDPFYVFEEGKKPAPGTPCLLVQKKSELIIKLLDGTVIGRGIPAPR